VSYEEGKKVKPSIPTQRPEFRQGSYTNSMLSSVALPTRMKRQLIRFRSHPTGQMTSLFVLWRVTSGPVSQGVSLIGEPISQIWCGFLL